MVVDNLSSGKRENLNPAARFYELDICDPMLEEVFRQEKIYLEADKAARELNWDSQVDLREGLRRTVEYLANDKR